MGDDNLEQVIRDDVEDLKGRTFRCNTEDCETMVAMFPEEDTPTEEELEEGVVCEECGNTFEQIHPADFILTNPLMEPEEEAIPILKELAEETYPRR